MKLNKIHICLSLAALATFSACTQEETLSGDTPNGGGAAFVVSTITPLSRVSHQGYVHSEMEEGDELGGCVIEKTGGTVTVNGKQLPEYAFMSGYTENARFRVVEGRYQDSDGLTYTHALQAEVPTDIFPANQRYVFYYPYKAGADIQHFSHTVVADQSRKTAFESSDLLRARVNGTADESVVSPSVIGTDETTGQQLLGVKMEHVMASVVLKVESDLVPEEGREAKLLNMYLTVSGIDLTRALSKDEQPDPEHAYETQEGEKVDPGNITMWNQGQEKETETTDGGEEKEKVYEIFRAVFPAQTVEHDTRFLSFLFKGDKEPKIYWMNVNGNKDLAFEPGKYYLFTLTAKDGLRFRGIIKDLEDGGDYFYEY